jgi:hypothetical protein
MMRSKSLMLLMALLAGSAVACSSEGGGGGGGTDAGNTPTDMGGNPTDTGNNPTDTGNTPTDSGGNPTDTGMMRTDGGGGTDASTGPVDAGPPYDPCAMGAVVDITRTGTTSRITGNNSMVGGLNAIRTTCGGSPGHQVVFRYVPGATSRLRISTDNMGTGMTLDTVVQAQTSCMSIGADAGTTGILGCSDDGAATGSTRRFTSAFTTNAPAMMGQPVFIVVGGYLNSARQPIMGNTAQGAFELSVTEITTVMPGGMCDPTGAANSCATGSRCVTPTGAMMGTCVADGALNGNCREGMTNRCDMGLQCSSTTGSGTCRTLVMAGGMCNTTSTVCATGSTCVIPSGATMGTCVAAGTRGGSCRTDAPRCDMGLECASSVCAQVVMAGAACDGRGIICASGSACVIPTGAAMGTCRAAGTAAGTACREAAPRCDMGLECSTMTGAGVCRANIAAGGACVPGSTTERCAMGTLCSPTSATAGTCAMAASGVTPGTMPMGAPVATMSRVYGGSVAAMARHCYAVTVPMGAGLFVQSGLAANRDCTSGAMAPDPVVTVFNPMGTEIEEFDDTTGFGLCAVGIPSRNASLRGLAAGNYAVCIEGFGGSAVMGYLLSVGIVPAS